MTPHSPSLKYRIALAIAFISLAAMLGSQPAPREQVGPLPGGAFLLNSGWRLDPVGRQVALDTLPMSTALSPDGKYLLVLNGGYRPPCHNGPNGGDWKQCCLLISGSNVGADHPLGRMRVMPSQQGSSGQLRAQHKELRPQCPSGA